MPRACPGRAHAGCYPAALALMPWTSGGVPWRKVETNVKLPGASPGHLRLAGGLGVEANVKLPGASPGHLRLAGGLGVEANLKLPGARQGIGKRDDVNHEKVPA